jgi:ketosteroid isomerase-like protein
MGTRQTLFMILSMTIMMGVILSGVFTWQAMGFGAVFIGVWASRFVSTYVIVLPTVLVVSPIAQRFARWLDGVLSPPPRLSPREVVLAAWRDNAAGHGGDDFAPWLAALADDVRISMPLGPFRGETVGKEGAARIYGAIAAAEPRLVYEEPLRVTENGNSVVIEFDDHGTISGMPYRNRIAASFDVRDGKISAYREYFGDIDPAVVAMMTASPDQPASAPEDISR